MILTITAAALLSPNINALGQTSSSSSLSSSTTNTTQQIWIDKLNNPKMQFGYLPKEPVIDEPTELKFTVQNLQTGYQIKNLSARVVVINNAGGQQRSFKFTNITTPNSILGLSKSSGNNNNTKDWNFCLAAKCNHKRSVDYITADRRQKRKDTCIVIS